MTPKVYWIPYRPPGRLAIVARPRGNDWLADELTGLRQTGFDVLVSLLTSDENIALELELEGVLAEQQGLTLKSFAVRDYDVPVSQTDFALLVDEIELLLSRGKTIGIHCRQSIGRSSLLVACLLSRVNQNVDECFKLIEESRGTRVPDTPAQRGWVQNFARECFPLLNR
jgi:protein-tyrosine phosphatase